MTKSCVNEWHKCSVNAHSFRFVSLILQRYDIVNGVVEVEGVTNEAMVEEGEEKAHEGNIKLY